MGVRTPSTIQTGRGNDMGISFNESRARGYDNLVRSNRRPLGATAHTGHGRQQAAMLLETAEELAQLALAVAAMYLALRLVLRLQQSPWGAHVQRRRAGVTCLLALVAAAVMVAEDTLKGQSGPIDTAMLLWLREHVPAALTPWFEAITFSASSTVLTSLTIVATAGLLASRQHSAALLVAGSVVCAALAVYGMKVIIGRERPALWDVQWYWGSSFPSGHTLVVAAFAISAALVAGHVWPAVRVGVLLLALAWTLLVGLSRLVLGVHWPTDVMVAACLGMAIPLGFGLMLEARRHWWKRDAAKVQAD
jgi:undecaprenyl-diphosphatase